MTVVYMPQSSRLLAAVGSAPSPATDVSLMVAVAASPTRLFLNRQVFSSSGRVWPSLQTEFGRPRRRNRSNLPPYRPLTTAGRSSSDVVRFQRNPALPDHDCTVAKP